MAPVIRQPPVQPPVRPLENGERLSAHEFLRRYEQMPELKRPNCYGGPTSADAKGYLQGGPELIIEIAGRSASLDAHDKLRSYRRAGVPEYLL